MKTPTAKQSPLTASSSNTTKATPINTTSTLKRPRTAVTPSTKTLAKGKQSASLNTTPTSPRPSILIPTENQGPSLHELFPNLAQLELLDWSTHSELTFESLKNFTSLCHLSITKCTNLTDAQFFPFLYSNKGLTHLNLSGCANLDGTAFLHPSREKERSNLIYLNLGGCTNLSNRSVVRIARFCPFLQTVILDGCAQVSDAIFGFANCQLQSFSFKNRKLPDRIAESFVRKVKGLKSLSLSMSDDFLSKDDIYTWLSKGHKHLTDVTFQGDANFEVTYKKTATYLEEFSVTQLAKQPLNQVTKHLLFKHPSYIQRSFTLPDLTELFLSTPILNTLSIPNVMLNDETFNRMFKAFVGLKTLRLPRLSFPQVNRILRTCPMLEEFSFKYDAKFVSIASVLKILEELDVVPLLSRLEFKPLLSKLPTQFDFKKNRSRLKIAIATSRIPQSPSFVS
eukprot:TRINITY_DN9138_c0_g1_i1.p1 TRINITY_DN9138_c0_g1~~TRINITY_DN9138_c0_g1_i1.p1  ORF type:complete len:453 (+),score=59.97 TRINITY_DN9138_c0_g1_i1:514-1872(+)